MNQLAFVAWSHHDERRWWIFDERRESPTTEFKALNHSVFKWSCFESKKHKSRFGFIGNFKFLLNHAFSCEKLKLFIRAEPRSPSEKAFVLVTFNIPILRFSTISFSSLFLEKHQHRAHRLLRFEMSDSFLLSATGTSFYCNTAKASREQRDRRKKIFLTLKAKQDGKEQRNVSELQRMGTREKRDFFSRPLLLVLHAVSHRTTGNFLNLFRDLEHASF